MSTTPLDSIRAAVRSSDSFASSYLELCTSAYTSSGNRNEALQLIPARVPNFQQYSQYPGKWSVLWGPQATNDNSNLMYAASYDDQSTGEPIFAAVVIRGTDVIASPAGIFQQIGEDIDVHTPVPWPYQPGPAMVAQGTLSGLQNKLLPMTDPTSGQTIVEFLDSYLTQHAGVPIVVTGHSLGGCQTTVMALYLQSVLPAGTSLVPNSFAAPTAGNPAFAALYEATFPYCPRWYNTLDVVPLAWGDVVQMPTLWLDCPGNNVPSSAEQVILAQFADSVQGIPYQQAGSPRPLQGRCMPPDYSLVGQLGPYLAQVVYQHFPFTGYPPTLDNAPGVLPFVWTLNPPTDQPPAA